MKRDFERMSVSGNELIVINNLDGMISLRREVIRDICNDSNADGIILAEEQFGADGFMNYFNRDGSIAEICGNGILITADFLSRALELDKEKLKIASRAGIKKVINQHQRRYTVDMGRPRFTEEHPIRLKGMPFHTVCLGNPHAVTLVEDLDQIPLTKLGPEIEHDPHFPDKTNVEVVHKINEENLDVRVWERGAGITNACGSGACASFAVAKKLDLVQDEVTVSLPGGDLQIGLDERDHLLMTGQVETLKQGELDLTK